MCPPEAASPFGPMAFLGTADFWRMTIPWFISDFERTIRTQTVSLFKKEYLYHNTHSHLNDHK